MSGRRPPRDSDDSEFREAMSEAKPFEDRDKLREAPKTLRRRKRRVDAPDQTAAFEIDRLGERIEGIAPGIDRDVLRRLRSGEIKRDARLDLHGLHAPAARRRVHERLRSVHAEGGRCVLVIHGRGRHSEGEPVLKDALLEWLAEPPVASLVMAFASASGGDGGVGATYVLLRSER